MNGFDLRPVITVHTATRFRVCQRGQETVLGFVSFVRRAGNSAGVPGQHTRRVVTPEAFIHENTNRYCLFIQRVTLAEREIAGQHGFFLYSLDPSPGPPYDLSRVEMSGKLTLLHNMAEDFPYISKQR